MSSFVFVFVRIEKFFCPNRRLFVQMVRLIQRRIGAVEGACPPRNSPSKISEKNGCFDFFFAAGRLVLNSQNQEKLEKEIERDFLPFWDNISIFDRREYMKCLTEPMLTNAKQSYLFNRSLWSVPLQTCLKCFRS